MKKRPTYLKAVIASLGKMLAGMRLTGKHYVKGYDRAAPLGIADPNYFNKAQGPITIQYPQEKVPVPDNGRYRLYMETDDCIGCDKCARICPVDCITIETFRANGDLGRTSDGTMKRLHLPTFDIDMGKCMYCGLCTTVCPTECLTMTPVYDYSEYDRDNFVYHFGAYSPADEGRIRLETETSLAAKKAAKEVRVEEQKVISGEETPVARPRPRPVVKSAEVEATDGDANIPPIEETKTEDRPTVRPRPKPMMKPKVEGEPEAENTSIETPSVKPRPRPVMKPTVEEEGQEEVEALSTETETPSAKPRPRPVMKPKVEEEAQAQSTEIETPSAKPRSRPIMKLKVEDVPEKTAEEVQIGSIEETPVSKPRPRPIMRPMVEDELEKTGDEEQGGDTPEKDGGSDA